MKTLYAIILTAIGGGDNPGMGPYDAAITRPVGSNICYTFPIQIDGRETKICAQMNYRY